MKQRLQTIARNTLIIGSALMVAAVVAHLLIWPTLFPEDEATAVEENTDRPPFFGGNNRTKECVPFDITLGEKVAVLRVDDVQGYTWGETTRLMIDEALSRNIPLTLGVIPKGFSEDVRLGTYLKQRECNLEIALHGWNHQVQEDGVTPEFSGLSEEEAATKLTWGIHEVRKVFDVEMKTWIPPENQQSEGSAAAVAALGFTRQSTEGDGEWDYDATSYRYGGDQTLLEPETVVADCEAQITEDGKCIIMLHPQQYADELEHDAETFENYYVALLDQLEAAGYTFARFEDLDTAE